MNSEEEFEFAYHILYEEGISFVSFDVVSVAG